MKSTIAEREKEVFAYIRLGMTWMEIASRLEKTGGFPRLTSKEIEILFYMTRGRTSKEIAALIKISPRTVETHTRNLRQKISREVGIKVNDLNQAKLTQYCMRKEAWWLFAA